MQRSNEVQVVIGIDPGRSKCGIAVVSHSGDVICSGIVATDEIEMRVVELMRRFKVSAIAIGNGTGSRYIVKRLIDSGIDERMLVIVDERFTTLEARRRYFMENPPRGWRRLIPITLQTPPEPYDHYVAMLIAERHLKTLGESKR